MATANTQLESTIDKILDRTEGEILSSISSAADEARQSLDGSIPLLEQEYDKIISDGRKEADKISRQIVGSADLDIRNKQLLALEEAVDRVFERALERIASTDRRGSEYATLIRSLLAESTATLGSKDVVISTSAEDMDTVRAVLQDAKSDYPGAEVSPEPFACLGGILVRSKDGTMTFDNTIDARIERMKPLIRKEIASKFGAGN